MQVSFAAKHALVRVLRPKVKRRRVAVQQPQPQPPPEDTTDATTTAAGASQAAAATPRQPAQGASAAADAPNRQREQNALAEALNVGPRGVRLGGIAGNLDALLPELMVGNIPPPVLDMPGAGAGGPDVDDEAMVELAIALRYVIPSTFHDDQRCMHSKGFTFGHIFFAQMAHAHIINFGTGKICEENREHLCGL